MTTHPRTAAGLLLMGVLLAAPGAGAKPPVKPVPQKSAPHAAARSGAAAPATRVQPLPAANPNAARLDTVATLAASGATELALQYLDRDQPAFSDDPAGWMSWERQRILIYQSTRDWKALTGRERAMPAGVSTDFRAWEEMQVADAWLHLGQGDEALARVAPLIWGSDTPPDDRTLPALRRLVIRSYFATRQLDDAQATVIRYRQDYPKDAGDWPLLEARLFLRTQQPQSALDVLQGLKGPEADMLALLASLRSGAFAPAEAMTQAVRVGSDSKLPDEERMRAWIIAAEAAGDLQNPVARISALQNALGFVDGGTEPDDIFNVTPEMLWDAYMGYGQELGNELQLVVGDDQAWFLAASNRFDSDPVRACALFSVVAFHTRDPQQQDVAHWQFAVLIQKQKNGGVVLRHLYLDSGRFKHESDIPADVRYLLVDDVLDIPDIPLASRLMQGLDAPPPDTSAADWQLQRARVFVLGGNPDAGVAALKQLFAGEPAPTPAPAAATVKAAPLQPAPDPDEVLPVLFDLQTLGRDQDAIPFFEALLSQDMPSEQRRQMLYWTADSYKALKDYPRAAELYLRSATLLDPYAMDPWAQTARYQAAQMLAQDGDIEDARNLYRGLLNATRDPARQAVLEHDMQQLMLMQAKRGKN